MIGLLQRVSEAQVSVDGRQVAAIGSGLAVLVGVQRQDAAADARRLAQRLLGYRMFADARGRMNLSLADIGGELLLVPQFTLVADTAKGMRASFAGAAPPEQAERLFESLVQVARAEHPKVATGVFGAHMQLSLTNDGPVTFWLSS